MKTRILGVRKAGLGTETVSGSKRVAAMPKERHPGQERNVKASPTFLWNVPSGGVPPPTVGVPPALTFQAGVLKYGHGYPPDPPKQPRPPTRVSERAQDEPTKRSQG